MAAAVVMHHADVCMQYAVADGRRGTSTRENKGLQLAKRGYGCCHLLHHAFANFMAVEVQEDGVGGCVQPAHQLKQLIARQSPEAWLL